MKDITRLNARISELRTLILCTRLESWVRVSDIPPHLLLQLREPHRKILLFMGIPLCFRNLHLTSGRNRYAPFGKPLGDRQTLHFCQSRKSRSPNPRLNIGQPAAIKMATKAIKAHHSSCKTRKAKKASKNYRSKFGRKRQTLQAKRKGNHSKR